MQNMGVIKQLIQNAKALRQKEHTVLPQAHNILWPLIATNEQIHRINKIDVIRVFFFFNFRNCGNFVAPRFIASHIDSETKKHMQYNSTKLDQPTNKILLLFIYYHFQWSHFQL